MWQAFGWPCKKKPEIPRHNRHGTAYRPSVQIAALHSGLLHNSWHMVPPQQQNILNQDVKQ